MFVFLKRNFAIILTLLFGAYVRLYKIHEYMTFLGDEGRDAIIVKNMIVFGKWTLLGPTASVGGFFMGPIYYYFMLPFLWASRLNPVGPAIMVALFGIVTIFLVYFVGQKWFSKTIGIMAAGLYALSPLIISYSRSSWNPNIVPFFSLLLVYLLWRIAVYNSWKLLFWVGVIVGVALQLHYTVLFLCVFLFIWLVLQGQWDKRIKYYIQLLIGFVIGFSPFLAFEVRHGFSNSKSILAFVFGGKDTGFSVSLFIHNVVDVYTRLFSRIILRIPETGMLGNLPYTIKNTWITGSIALAGIAGIVLLALIIRKKFFDQVFRLSPKEAVHVHEALRILLMWLVIPLIMFGFYKKNIYDYYFGIFYPVPFFMTGLCIYCVYQWKTAGKIIGVSLFIGLLLFNWEGRPFKYPGNNQLKQMETVAAAVIEKTNGKPYNFALVSGGNSDHAYRYFFELWNKSPVTIVNPDIDPTRSSVTEQLLIVCEDTSCKPLGNSLWEIAGFGSAEIEGEWDVIVAKVYKLGHYKEH